MFASDRDLLVLEPRLFHDVGWSAQTLVNSASAGSINAAGTTLTVTGVDFVALGVEAGFVALVAGSPFEVLARLSATQLSVSRPRAHPDDAPIPGVAGSGLAVLVQSFRPQVGIVHGQVLRALGLAQGDEPGDASRPTEAQVTNPQDLALVEALGALHLVFASAAALVSDNSLQWVKAQMYRQRFAEERARVAAEIDLNNDGAPDAVRRMSVLQMVR